MSNVTIYKPVLDRFLNSKLGPVGTYMTGLAQEVSAGAKLRVGTDSGTLRGSIHVGKRGRNVRGQYIEVSADAPHALAHHEGTKPRVIVPENRRVLRFFSKGVMVFTTVVQHPGTRPNRYLLNSLKASV